MIDGCKTRMAASMGSKYRDIVLKCLTCGDQENATLANSLEDIYFDIVLELERISAGIRGTPFDIE